MTKRDDRTGQGSELRRRAEEVVLENAARSPGKQAPLLPEEMREALHDLQVHQIELKMQNLELLRSHVELDAARARYFDLYDLAPVGYLTLSEEGVILEANLAAATLLGVARGTLVWQLFNRFVFKEDQDSHYLYGKQHFKSDTELREEPVEGGATFRQSSGGESAQLPGCELRMVKKDGTPFWVHLAATATQGKDGTPEYRVVLTDITDGKRAEEEKGRLEAQLQHAQKMESVGQLAGGVAHEFNNMLSVIIGYAQVAIMKLEAGEPSPPVITCLTEIRKAADRSADITRQLLAFARKQAIAPIAVELNETLVGMFRMIQQLIGEEIDLCWQPGANLWPVKVDPSQIDQILANLCLNARDAISGVGRIIIKTGNITLDERYCATHEGYLPGDYVRLAVSDNGCGMGEEVLGQIFEPFFTTKGVGEGTGLGLATVYGIVRQNNGCIEVESERGRGTTVTIHLPRCLVGGEEREKDGLTESLRGHETILLVEDEPSILEITTTLLELLGYTVLAAGAPSKAILLAEEAGGKIDLLMTDLIMPGMSGVELAKKLLSRYPHLKRLFMSGYTPKSLADRGVLAEGVHFIEKPFSISDLACKVREVLES